MFITLLKTHNFKQVRKSVYNLTKADLRAAVILFLSYVWLYEVNYNLYG